MPDADQLVVAGTGRVLAAPVGTAFPADVATAFGASWKDLGYTTDDGVQFTDGKSTDSFSPWQSFYAVRRWVTSRETNLAFTLAEWSYDSVPLAFGGGAITEPTAGNYVYTPPDPGETDDRALAVEWVDDAKIYRVYVPVGNVSDNVESSFTKTGPSLLPITFGVLGTDGSAPWTLHTNDPSFEAPA